MSKENKIKSVILVKFGELWLKGRNRDEFIKILYKNIIAKIKEEKYDRLAIERDRFVLYLITESDTQSILNKMEFVFGISWFARSAVVENNMAAITDAVKSIAKDKRSVRIEAHRSFKKTNFDSSEIVRSFIKNAGALKINFDKDSNYVVNINVTSNGTFVYDKKIRGLGGLPVGSSGRAISLISGGIDSPVASFYAMKRGLELVYLHLHSFQTNEEASKEKLQELAKILSIYSPTTKIYYLPSHIFQSSVIRAGERYELVLLKRFMYKIAEKIAKNENASAIVSGESLGQVASQTLDNLTASQAGIKLFVFRPLIGMDKEEIISIAKKIGTYPISIKEYKDVCSLNSRNPSLKADPKRINDLYKRANLGKALSLTLKRASSVEIY